MDGIYNDEWRNSCNNYGGACNPLHYEPSASDASLYRQGLWRRKNFRIFLNWQQLKATSRNHKNL